MRGLGDPILIDGGAQVCISNDMSIIHHYRDYQPNFSCQGINGAEFTPTGYGYLFLDFGSNYAKLKCWYTTENIGIIISEKYMHSIGINTVLTKRDPLDYELTYKSGMIPLITKNFHSHLSRLYIVPPPKVLKIASLHSRMGHINPRYLLPAAEYGTITGIDTYDNKSLNNLIREENCEACLIGKARRKNAVEGSRDPYLNDQPFNIVYSDICQVTEGIQGKRDTYFITFKDAISNFLVIYSMKRKSDTKNRIKRYINWVKTRFSTKNYRVKKLISDQGSEYLSNNVKSFLELKVYKPTPCQRILQLQMELQKG